MSKQIMEAMRLIGQSMASQIKEKGAAMDGTAIIDAEVFIPEWQPGKYEVVGQPVRYGEQVYKVLQIHDSTANPAWTPDEASLFEIMHTKDAAKAKPYIAPFGTSGLYSKDEVCLWTDGKVYKSKVDNNAYSPGEYAANWVVVEG